jgi:hypothetical protein
MRREQVSENTKALVLGGSMIWCLISRTGHKQNRKVEFMFCIRITIAALLLVTPSAFAQARDVDDVTSARCWKEWVAFLMKEVPRAEDTVSPATGRELSQTDGAKRTRALNIRLSWTSLNCAEKMIPF